MEITEIKVFPVREEKLKAFVSVVLDDCFMVNDIKIIQGRESRFISMPSRRKKSGDFKDVAHPLNNETRRMMENRILAEYDRVLAARADGAAEESEPASRRGKSKSNQAARDETGELSRANAGVPMAASTEAGSVAESADDGENTLEEVAEKHLSDSFWTT